MKEDNAKEIVDCYHYVECGLDYVYLQNGYTVEETEWGRATSVVNPDGLHRLIGERIVESGARITGQELKFIRVQMDMTQKHLGEILGYSDRQPIATQESRKTEDVSKSIDIIVRSLYKEFLKGGGSSSITALVGKLADNERADFRDRKETFLNTDTGWEFENEQMCA